MSVDGKDNHGPRGEMAPEERAAFEKRSAELARKLDAARHAKDGGAGSKSGGGAGRGPAMARALRVSTELIGGIVVGGAIGWFLDKWLGLEKPWFFILFFLLGAAAGIMNVIRIAMREKKTPPLPSTKDDDEDR